MQTTINILGTNCPILRWEEGIEIYRRAYINIKTKHYPAGTEVWASELFNYISINDKIVHDDNTYIITGYKIHNGSVILKIKNRFNLPAMPLHPAHLDRDTLIKNKRISNIKEII